MIFFIALYAPFLSCVISLFVLRDYGAQHQKQFVDFFKRMVAGITGGLTVFIVTQFQLNLPPSPNIMDTVLPRLLNTVALVFLVFIVFLSMYVLIDYPKVKVSKPVKQGSTSKKLRKPRV